MALADVIGLGLDMRLCLEEGRRYCVRYGGGFVAAFPRDLLMAYWYSTVFTVCGSWCWFVLD